MGKTGKREKGRNLDKLKNNGKIKKRVNPQRGSDIGDAIEESRLVGTKICSAGVGE